MGTLTWRRVRIAAAALVVASGPWTAPANALDTSGLPSWIDRCTRTS
jgi:hypothetical protein